MGKKAATKQQAAAEPEAEQPSTSGKEEPSKVVYIG